MTRYDIKKEFVFKDGGSVISQAIVIDGGRISKIIERPVCGVCSKLIPRNIIRKCSECHRFVCQECANNINGTVICTSCILNLYPLSRREWNILRILLSTDNIRIISRVLHISRKMTKQSIKKLMKLGFVSKKGYSLFSKLYVTDDGLSAIKVLSKIYGQYEDELNKLKW